MLSNKNNIWSRLRLKIWLFGILFVLNEWIRMFFMKELLSVQRTKCLYVDLGCLYKSLFVQVTEYHYLVKVCRKIIKNLKKIHFQPKNSKRKKVDEYIKRNVFSTWNIHCCLNSNLYLSCNLCIMAYVHWVDACIFYLFLSSPPFDCHCDGSISSELSWFFFFLFKNLFPPPTII